MDDLLNRVNEEMDPLTKLVSKIPGFSGYIDRENRRKADKILREFIANKYEAQYRRVSSLQQDFISSLEFDHLDDVERAAIKIRQFIDRIRTAAYGYSGFFDAVKVNEAELDTVYRHDLALMDMSDQLERAVDNVETSMATEGLPAAIRNLIGIAQSVLDEYNLRAELLMGRRDETPDTASTVLPSDVQ